MKFRKFSELTVGGVQRPKFMDKLAGGAGRIGRNSGSAANRAGAVGGLELYDAPGREHARRVHDGFSVVSMGGFIALAIRGQARRHEKWEF